MVTKGTGRKGHTDKPMGDASMMVNQPIPLERGKLIVVRVGKYSKGKQKGKPK